MANVTESTNLTTPPAAVWALVGDPAWVSEMVSGMYSAGPSAVRDRFV